MPRRSRSCRAIQNEGVIAAADIQDAHDKVCELGKIKQPTPKDLIDLIGARLPAHVTPEAPFRHPLLRLRQEPLLPWLAGGGVRRPPNLVLLLQLVDSRFVGNPAT